MQPSPSPRPLSAASSNRDESRPMSGKVSARGSLGGLSRTSTPGPSNELQEVLEKLGQIGSEHTKLEGRVSTLEVSRCCHLGVSVSYCIINAILYKYNTILLKRWIIMKEKQICKYLYVCII